MSFRQNKKITQDTENFKMKETTMVYEIGFAYEGSLVTTVEMIYFKIL